MPKVKAVKLKSKKREKEMGRIGDLMESLLRSGSDSDDYSNMQIVFDKYVKLRELLELYLRNVTTLLVKVNTKSLNDQIRGYKETIFAEYKKYCKLDITPFRTTLDITTLDVALLRQLRDTYVALRESFITLTSIMVAKNILSCKLDGKSLNKKGRYDEFCALAYKGDTELRIFNYIKVGEHHNSIDFDFCVLFNGGNVSMAYSADVKKAIFAVIVSLCEVGRKVDKIKNSIDIDAAEIFPKLIGVIRDLKPKIRGCDRAFSIIEDSAEVFEKNCNKYIRKATKGGNPMCMFTDFITDIIACTSEKVAGGSSAERPIVGELKKVMMELRRMMANAAVSMPDNVKFVVDMADSIIEEYENNVDGDLPTTSEVRERQKHFADIFIP